MSSSIVDRLGGRTAATGFLVSAVVLLLVVGNFSGVLRKLFAAGDRQQVSAIFPSTQQLRKGDLVRISGVTVGKVTSITSLSGGRQAQVVMGLDGTAGPLYADAGAAIRWRTLLGADFYVALDRGHASDGPLHATIPASRTTNQVELDDVTSIFQNGARQGLQTLPREASAALSDHRTPAKLLGTLAGVSPELTTALDAARGQQPDADLQQLIKATARTTDILGSAPGELRAVVTGAAATLETTGAHAAAIRDTLAAAPGTLRDTDATLSALDGTLAVADPLVKKLHKPAGRVGPTLHALNPTVRGADALLTRARPLLRDLRPTVRSLARTSVKGLPLLTDLQPSIDRTEQTILPYLAAKDPGTQKSTTVMIGGTFAGLGAGSAGQEDANGHFLRFALTSGSAPLYLPCQTYINNPDQQQQLQCNSLQSTLNTILTYNPVGASPGGSAPAPDGSHG